MLLVCNYIGLIVVHSSSLLCDQVLTLLWAVAVRPNPWKDVSTLEFISKKKTKHTQIGAEESSQTGRQLNLLLLSLEKEKQNPRIT